MRSRKKPRVTPSVLSATLANGFARYDCIHSSVRKRALAINRRVVRLHFAPFLGHGNARGFGERFLLASGQRIEPRFAGDQEVRVEQQPGTGSRWARPATFFPQPPGEVMIAVHRSAREPRAHLDRRENDGLCTQASYVSWYTPGPHAIFSPFMSPERAPGGS